MTALRAMVVFAAAALGTMLLTGRMQFLISSNNSDENAKQQEKEGGGVGREEDIITQKPAVKPAPKCQLLPQWLNNNADLVSSMWHCREDATFRVQLAVPSADAMMMLRIGGPHIETRLFYPLALAGGEGGGGVSGNDAIYAVDYDICQSGLYSAQIRLLMTTPNEEPIFEQYFTKQGAEILSGYSWEEGESRPVETCPGLWTLHQQEGDGDSVSDAGRLLANNSAAQVDYWRTIHDCNQDGSKPAGTCNNGPPDAFTRMVPRYSYQGSATSSLARKVNATELEEIKAALSIDSKRVCFLGDSHMLTHRFNIQKMLGDLRMEKGGKAGQKFLYQFSNADDGWTKQGMTHYITDFLNPNAPSTMDWRMGMHEKAPINKKSLSNCALAVVNWGHWHLCPMGGRKKRNSNGTAPLHPDDFRTHMESVFNRVFEDEWFSEGVIYTACTPMRFNSRIKSAPATDYRHPGNIIRYNEVARGLAAQHEQMSYLDFFSGALDTFDFVSDTAHYYVPWSPAGELMGNTILRAIHDRLVLNVTKHGSL